MAFHFYQFLGLRVTRMALQESVDPRLGGFFENIQDEHFPKFWYWMDDEELRTRCESEGWDYSEVLGISHGPSGGLYSAAQELERSAR